MEPTTDSENVSQDTLESFDKSPGPALVSFSSLDTSPKQTTPPPSTTTTPPQMLPMLSSTAAQLADYDGEQASPSLARAFLKDHMEQFEQDSLEVTEEHQQPQDQQQQQPENQQQEPAKLTEMQDKSTPELLRESLSGPQVKLAHETVDEGSKVADEPQASVTEQQEEAREPPKESIVPEEQSTEPQKQSTESHRDFGGVGGDVDDNNESDHGEENKENVQVDDSDQEEEEPHSKGQVTFDVEEKSEQQGLGDVSNLIKLEDFANEILNQTFESAANISHFPTQTEQVKKEPEPESESELESESESEREIEPEPKTVLEPKVEPEVRPEPEVMEFTKNYSDDLLMGSGEQRSPSGANVETGGHDLADFELPPYNGSSSGSEQAATKHSPVKQRKSSSTGKQAPSSSHSASGLVPTDLSAVKNVIISFYSKFSHIFQWNKPIESGIIFAIGLIFIAALTFFSIISVVAYSALGIVLASGLIRVYKTGMKALNKSTETPVDHLWEKALDLNVSMSPERLHELIDTSHANLNASLVYVKQVLLVEDKVATLKFALFLYSLTYIGAWFNGLTLITISYVSLFSVPIFYEKNKTNIDQYLNLATNQVSSAISTVTSKVSTLAFGTQSSASSKKQN